LSFFLNFQLLKFSIKLQNFIELEILKRNILYIQKKMFSNSPDAGKKSDIKKDFIFSE